MIKLKKIKPLIYLGLATINFLPLLAAQAASAITNTMLNQVNSSVLQGIPSGGSVEGIIGNVIQAFLSIFGIIFLALMLYAGYVWLKAQGREEEVERAKSMIKAAIIGLAITLSAYTIAYFVVTNLATTTQ